MAFPLTKPSSVGPSLAAFLLCANAALSQTVRVQNMEGEFGHGWMFDHRGTCYVILPGHVAGDGPFLTIWSAAPVATGSGTIIRPFWDGIDLALAVAREGIRARCVEDIERLEAPAAARRATRAQLEKLTDTGEIDRAQLTIEDRRYLTFFGTTPGEAGIGGGTSGAFAQSKNGVATM